MIRAMDHSPFPNPYVFRGKGDHGGALEREKAAWVFHNFLHVFPGIAYAFQYGVSVESDRRMRRLV
jgi:hypothetical protein